MKQIPKVTNKEISRLGINFMDDPANFLMTLANKFGDVLQFKLGPFKVTLISNPSMIQEVLIGKVQQFPKSTRETQILSKAIGQGIVTADQQTHKPLRKIAQPAFMHRRLQNYQDVFEQYALESVSELNHDDTVDMAAQMERLSLQITCKTLFDLSKSELKKTSAVSDAMNELHHLLSKNFESVVNFPAWFPSPLNLRIKRTRKIIEQIIDEILHKRKSEPFVDHGDLLSSLLEATDETGNSLTNENIKDHLISYFIVGHETTSNSLIWCWYCLAKYKVEASNVYKEVTNHKSGEPLSFDKFPATLAFIKEVLRLFPPVWLIGARRARENTNINGFKIKKGEKVFISPFVAHRLKSNFNKPEHFNPSRWENDPDIKKGSYIPFGAGHRNCIGQHFSMQEMLSVLVTYLKQTRIAFLDEGLEPLNINARSTLSNHDGLVMKVNKLIEQ
ncbi:cytochrome P450 [Pseudoalteromonas luteoviolacea]|uniref:Cytochrome P450 n=1 Tax=Pseudoalteromonas luteoviolacea S4054 TaxID=1129367 RepID=A0A0F6AC12_9GAMM|nr:cytochrome P450 [Pseudoalteromonas luteoviolacea]AOD41650.1 cytochrome P450 [synthetic construct]AOT08778.1 hypothetical protein S4054249_13350 [Pseudoalteromonas luteoviolacea]AOT13692.1 hypothetical protein S40542_13320 [Pseudoalteromonas luteoviolacea]AOT18606.1 hypothetical protein S4054_13325 [Pseudoalteromonas luteoviolacea]KKE82924.1 hypothetical protein N479_16060 [Pseudoalteromonas luteoviolacea S4054]